VLLWSRSTDPTFYLKQTQSPGIVRGVSFAGASRTFAPGVRRDKAALSSGCLVVEQRSPRIRGPPKMLLRSILATLERAVGALIDRQRSAGYLEIRRRNGRCWRKAAVHAQQHLVVDKHELEMESVGD
jgi:hypothetical protein